jgi:Zn-dependent protease
MPKRGRYTEHVSDGYDPRVRELAAEAFELLRQNQIGPAQNALAKLVGLLPGAVPQRAALLQGLTTLSLHVSTGSHPPPELIDRLAGLAKQISAMTDANVARHQSKGNTGKKLGPIGVALALLAKFKTVAFIALTKGKLLWLGLTNVKFLISILAFLGIYWAMYGWWFALGFVFSIFVHEMGHYVTVRRYGFSAQAPVFIPGFGAFVRWQGANVDPVTRARISLAGPLFGLFAAFGSLIVYEATGRGVWLAVAQVGAWINLLNMIPVFIFDGGGAFIALGRQERLAVVVVSLALWFFLSETLFLFIAIGAGYRVFKRDFPQQSSQSAAYYFLGLLISLGLLAWWTRLEAGALHGV